LAHRAKVLSWVSPAHVTFEGAVAIVAGVVAGSVAPIGFGIDSAIKGFASLVIVWRFTGHRLLSEHAERRAQRLVAISLLPARRPSLRSPSCRISDGPSSASARPWARSPSSPQARQLGRPRKSRRRVGAH
jgi:hypothetical protein